MKRWAEISDCGRYRYLLGRRWGESSSCMTFVMLNPSTADAEVDDPTIRRCMGFAQREGHAGIMVINLFAFRATKPTELLDASSPCGRDNHSHVMAVLRSHAALDGGPVVAAWGSFFDARPMMRHLALPIEECAQHAGVDLLAFGLTKSGAPRHPLYLKADSPLIDYHVGTDRSST